MTEQDQVERVAKAINGPHDATHIGEEKLRELQDHKWEKQTTKDRDSCLNQARADIAAMQPTPQMQCIHMTAEMAANCPTCNPSALRGLPKGEATPQRWQPIETAPKDGSWILLYECEGVYDTPDFTHWIASWRWTEDSCGWLDQNEDLVMSNPSHWMPLPAISSEDSK